MSCLNRLGMIRAQISNLKSENFKILNDIEKLQKQAEKDKKKIEDIKDKLKEAEKDLKSAEVKIERIPEINKMKMDKE